MTSISQKWCTLRRWHISEESAKFRVNELQRNRVVVSLVKFVPRTDSSVAFNLIGNLGLGKENIADLETHNYTTVARGLNSVLVFVNYPNTFPNKLSQLNFSSSSLVSFFLDFFLPLRIYAINITYFKSGKSECLQNNNK